MRPLRSESSSSSTSSPLTNGIKVWKSPIPYLFGGLALMLLLISIALVILVCSYRKHSSNSQSSSEEEEEENNNMKQQSTMMSKNMSEPELLVIMAGQNKPTYLAKPIISSSISYSFSLPLCTCESQPTSITTITPSSSSPSN
ncbi:hypothetical protein HN51_067942 [Arachis hypogaea]